MSGDIKVNGSHTFGSLIKAYGHARDMKSAWGLVVSLNALLQGVALLEGNAQPPHQAHQYHRGLHDRGRGVQRRPRRGLAFDPRVGGGE